MDRLPSGIDQGTDCPQGLRAAAALEEKTLLETSNATKKTEELKRLGEEKLAQVGLGLEL